VHDIPKNPDCQELWNTAIYSAQGVCSTWQFLRYIQPLLFCFFLSRCFLQDVWNKLTYHSAGFLTCMYKVTEQKILCRDSNVLLSRTAIHNALKGSLLSSFTGFSVD